MKYIKSHKVGKETDFLGVVESDGSKVYKAGISSSVDMNIWQDPKRGNVKAVSLNEFLSEKGLSSPILYQDDKIIGGHRMIARNADRVLREIKNEQEKYFENRQNAMSEYKKKLENGEIRKPTSIEKAVRKAQGHPDNPSVQAARRIAEKRGVDWRTGKPLALNFAEPINDVLS